MQQYPSLAQVNRMNLGEIGQLTDACHGGIECVLSDAASTVVVVFVTGLATVAAVLAFVHLRNASEALERERERTAAEQDAFAAFARRVANMDVTRSPTPPDRAGGAPLTHRSGATESGIPAVEDAYRETVASVPHYEEEYDEPAITHLTGEMGAEVGRAVERETALTPQLQSALVTKARAASELRGELVAAIDREAEQLSEAERTLREVDRRLESMATRPLTEMTFDELFAAHERLEELEAECASLLRDRQTTLHEQSFDGYRPSGDVPETLQGYLYEPLDSSHPVLADGTELIHRIRTARERVTAAVAAGPRGQS